MLRRSTNPDSSVLISCSKRNLTLVYHNPVDVSPDTHIYYVRCEVLSLSHLVATGKRGRNVAVVTVACMALLKGKGLCVASMAVCKEEGKSPPRQIASWTPLKGKGLRVAPTAVCKEEGKSSPRQIASWTLLKGKGLRVAPMAGSPEFVMCLLDFYEDLLKNSNTSKSRDHANVCIESFIPAVYPYEGDIQPETIRLVLVQITKLEDANLPENVQKILHKLKLFYDGGAKRDGQVDDVPKLWCYRQVATVQASQPSLLDLALWYMTTIRVDIAIL
ncbi:hypothetical protein V493_00265 [Pseudogymnoascus sp. VKM F-4281 (FW-2241)]|nr:hypothetical protein V493_00265 [Pseudogymnoascus sp. VKM F-4281 (FW-2241)]